uniref:Uncharacterized protein n=1 Tax=Myoviridae sp. ctRPH1 TaxID=2826650 RepID=A0A8S5MAV0_9CAUD|nr:MAG TPA: hypothetical protein [Myoviridae sp. ctRPH1]
MIPLPRLNPISSLAFPCVSRGYHITERRNHT